MSLKINIFFIKDEKIIIITKLVLLSPKQVYKTRLKGKGKVRLGGVKII